MTGNDDDGISIAPMKIFARKSLLNKIDHEKMFKLSRYGLKFFSEYFGLKYPFSKFDQIFSPSMNYEGLSSQGILSYAEHFLYPVDDGKKETEYRRAYFNIVVLHEIAHQWIGNVVTPKWWNDLWIMESLATFMSIKAFENYKDFEMPYDAKWIRFLYYKKWG